MNIDEKMNLIKTLTDLSGQMIVNKLEGKENNETLSKAKEIANKLSKEGIGDFDFTSDEKFEESLNNFLEVV